MQRTCRLSGVTFTLTERELRNCERLGVPPPSLSPDERHRRRTAYRNERNLYKRQCDATGKSLISIYPPEYPGKVYAQDYWWSDHWAGKDYGRDFDFERPFFDQIRELFRDVPQLSSVVTNSENCEFNSFCTGGKNCYMCQRIADSEDIYYSYLPVKSRNCVDCYNISLCELCYDVIDGENCYNVRYSQNVVNCNNSSFLFNCRNCSNCFLSADLRNAEYYFHNEKLSKDEYQRKVAAYEDLTFSLKRECWLAFRKLKATQIVPLLWGNMNENVTGNYIFQSKNIHHGFDCIGGEDVAYAWGHIYGKDCIDVNFTYHNDECYEFISGIKSSRSHFCYGVYNSCYDVEYSFHCVNNCHDLFGCVGLKHASHCLLNKQYSENEYRALRERVVAHMRKTGEWGEFFPLEHSPFAYNETVAHEYFPLTKDEVLARGWSWKTWPRESGVRRTKPHEIPDSITDVTDEICGELLVCENCGNDYKIQRQELQFYRTMKLPIPRFCVDCRYINRMVLRNPRVLFKRSCAQCQTPIETSFAPDRPEQVFCEACFLVSVSR